MTTSAYPKPILFEKQIKLHNKRGNDGKTFSTGPTSKVTRVLGYFQKKNFCIAFLGRIT